MELSMIGLKVSGDVAGVVLGESIWGLRRKSYILNLMIKDNKVDQNNGFDNN